MKNLFYCFTVCCLLWSCGTTNEKSVKNWSGTDSVVTQVLKTKPFTINSFGFVYYDNSLITQDLSNQSKRFVEFKVVGDSIELAARFLSVGRGEDEAFSAGIHPCDGHILMATNYNMVSIKNLYEISDNNKITDPKSYRKIEVPLNNEIWQISKIDEDNFIVTFAGHKHKSMFGILHIPTQTIRELTINYPGDNGKTASNTLAKVFAGTLLKRPFQQQYVYSTDEGNCVLLLKIENGEIAECKEVYSSYPQYVLIKNGADYTYDRSNNLNGYKPAVTRNFIYLLNRFHDSPKNKVVEIFDWSGNPIRKIVLDRGVKRIAVNEDDSIIYGLTTNEKGEDEIIKAIIPKFAL